VKSINNKLHLPDKENRWDLIITIGTKAAIKLNNYKTNAPTLFTLVPSHDYRVIKNRSSSRIKSAIYVDQPISRQLQLIKSVLQKIEKVGVLLGSHSGISKKRLSRLMNKMGLKPVIVNVTPKNIGSSLENIFGKVDALLAQPDPTVYNKKTVMTVLLSSYRHNIPVFGYSAAFVKSGATAAIYSSPSDIGKHIGDEIVKFTLSTNKTLSAPSFPKYFSVDTNRRVIRSLKINMPSKNNIKKSIIKAM
jgi:ABC-type uncharacterized transport system substrate-binding protein